MNGITNATFLEGTLGYGGENLAVDEEVRGGPGRAVLTTTGTSIVGHYSQGISANQGDLVEASVLAENGSSVFLQFENIPQNTEVPLKRVGDGPASRGLPHTMSYFRAKLPVLDTGRIRLRINGPAGLCISKPYLEVVQPSSRERVWAPGPHQAADLNLPVWPSNFPQFKPDTVQVTPTPVRRMFAGDVPIPATTRMHMTPAYNFRGDLELSSVEYDQLERLCYEESEPFWFVRPDTKQLCHAFWAEDGQPSAAGSHNVIRRVSVGLLLQVV